MRKKLEELLIEAEFDKSGKHVTALDVHLKRWPSKDPCGEWRTV